MSKLKAGMFTLKTELEFSAAHKLSNPYTAKCKELHGHNWKVFVSIEAESIDDNTGMIVDFKKIKDTINTLDHCYLNDIIPEPTAEQICLYLHSEINKLGEFNKVTIDLYENERNCISYENC